MKKYTDRNRKEVVKYKMEDKLLLSMKNLVWLIRNRKMQKLIERFIRLYIKKIISENAVELELLVLMKIYLVVNMSRILRYQEQVEKPKKILPSSVEIKEE